MLLAVQVVVIGAIVFAVAALTMGGLDRLAPSRRDTRARQLPDGEIHADDVRRTRFGMVVRGYRMSEVDAVLARLAEELAVRDDELARREEELERLAAFARLESPPPDGAGLSDAAGLVGVEEPERDQEPAEHGGDTSGADEHPRATGRDRGAASAVAAVPGGGTRTER